MSSAPLALWFGRPTPERITQRERAYQAQRRGAGAVLLAPGLTGFDTLTQLATAPDFHLPILSHPAVLGGFVAHPNHGFTHDLIFGTLPRLFGADISIFPSHGGRFSFPTDTCRQIAAACAAPLGDLPIALPSPAGGMTLERVAEMVTLPPPVST